MKALARHRIKEEDFTIKEKILYTLGGIVVLGGSIFLGRKLVLKGIANREEKRSLNDGSSATLAKQLKMAFENDGWPGTDIEAFRKTIRQIPSKDEFEKVFKSYQKLYGTSLQKDMSDKLQTTEYNEMLAIIASKPSKTGGTVTLNFLGWAKRLKAAFDKSYGPFPGTDEDAIKAVFSEVPSQAAFVEVGKAYWQEYSSNLIEDLKSELEIWEYSDFMKIITSKPAA